MLVNQIVFEEPLISENRKPQLRRLVHKLIEKLETNESDDFYLFKVAAAAAAAALKLKKRLRISYHSLRKDCCKEVLRDIATHTYRSVCIPSF